MIFGNFPQTNNVKINKILIFVGPQKTATTSFSKFALDIGFSDRRKEMYLTGFKFIDKFILLNQFKKKIIIWPYLLHRPKRLKHLIDIIQTLDVDFSVIITSRSYEKWLSSLKLHNENYSKPAFTTKGIITEILLSIDILEKLDGKVKSVDFYSSDLVVNDLNKNYIFSLNDYHENKATKRKKYNLFQFYLVDIYIKIKFLMMHKQ
jgi:hypothetical protein